MERDIKALTFDVGGSIFDWQTATRRAIRGIAETRGAAVDDGAFAMTWRRRMFQELARVRSGELPWQNADQLHRAVLDELADAHPQLELSARDRDELNRAWHRMGVWDDVPDALQELREHYIVAILTVLSLSIVVDSSKHAGIDWDACISCEFLGVYKPEAAAYRTAARLLGAEPREVMMVAVHPGDLLAAQQAGLRTGYVRPKLWEPGAEGPIESFDVVAEDYGEFARKLCDARAGRGAAARPTGHSR